MENVVKETGEIKKVIFTKPKNGRFFKQNEVVEVFRGTPTGDGWEHVLEIKFDPVTGEEITKVNNVHLFALIQESEGSCNLDYVIGEMSKGNMDVLEKTDGKFLDLTKLPKNIYELQEFERKTEDFYHKDAYIKRIYKTCADYRKALTSGVDIEKQIVDLYRKDMFDAQLLAKTKQEKEKVIGGK